MNVLTIFDQRISAIFAEGAPGTRLPFSFKRLAKRAVREMEDETFVIDGVDTAPALYTVLVSEEDDTLMRPMYVQITDELSQLIEAQAKKRGYTFVGRPLVRFMVDPALRRGRFSAFAENIDPRTLARLRDEENAYLGVTPPMGAYASQGFVPSPIPVHEEEPMPIAQEVGFAFEAEPPLEIVSDEPAMPASSQPIPEVTPEVEIPEIAAAPQAASVPVVGPLYPDMEEENASMGFAEPVNEPQIDPLDIIPDDVIPEEVPEPEPVPAPRHAAHAAPVAAPAEDNPVCTLVDLGSGQTYTITSSTATIGRENVQDGVVLSDPNVSRRHAEIFLLGGNWNVRDLNSTNGTLVNDIDVTEARLHNGDVLTIGLTNLEFQAG